MHTHRRLRAPARLASLATKIARAKSPRCKIPVTRCFSPRPRIASKTSSSPSPMCSTVSATGSGFGGPARLLPCSSSLFPSTATSSSSARRSRSAARARRSSFATFARASSTITRSTSSSSCSNSSRVSAPANGLLSACVVSAPVTPPRWPNIPPLFDTCDLGSEKTDDGGCSLFPAEPRDRDAHPPDSLAEYRVPVGLREVRSEPASRSFAPVGPRPRKVCEGNGCVRYARSGGGRCGATSKSSKSLSVRAP